MLIQVAKYIAERGGQRGNLSLFGRKNLGTWAICKMNMLCTAIPMPASKGATRCAIPSCCSTES